MNLLLALIIIGICFAGMAIGLLLSKRGLKRGCGITPDDCACLKEGKDPSQCDSTTPKKIEIDRD